MRWFVALCVALSAGAAGGQPVIVDPDPDPNLDWGLRLDHVADGLASPSALAVFGTRQDEKIFVLEKDTGKVRYFAGRIEQPLALDLAVDNCGERGLVGIALHPLFDPTLTPPPTSRPQDWVYLSYHTDDGRTDDGCDGDAELRVERFKWTGTQLVPDPLVVEETDPDTKQVYGPFVPIKMAVDSTTAVGGAIRADDFAFPTRLYLAIGSLEHKGRLQNNKDAVGLDDTSVILRLDENGNTPESNPFDADADAAAPGHGRGAGGAGADGDRVGQ